MFNDITPAILISRIIILVIAFTIHEFAHALTADYFGDDTPRLQGRLSLNPLVHLDPLGSLLLLAVGFGWARPVMVNPYALRRSSPAGPMLVAAAGPLSNLLMAVVAAIPVQAGLIALNNSSGRLFPTASQFISEFVFINLLLMLFNLIPLAPLDGEKVLYYFLPPAGQSLMDNLRPYSTTILLALLFIAPFFLRINIIGGLIGPPLNALFRLLLG
jgi:Zn-dependent protease